MAKLKIVVDEDECIGDSLCVQEAPGTFEMNDDDKAVVLGQVTDDEDTILEAAQACPVDAITVINEETGEKLHPKD